MAFKLIYEICVKILIEKLRRENYFMVCGNEKANLSSSKGVGGSDQICLLKHSFLFFFFPEQLYLTLVQNRKHNCLHCICKQSTRKSCINYSDEIVVLLLIICIYHSTFPGGASGKEAACQCRRCKRPGSLGGEHPLEWGMATHCSVLAWRAPVDRVAWWATVRSCK